ncbi:hypothetical protein BLOT_007721 [Blomia tropicalis]|nr:hypothetical protein BLOT_007721 [Blomia tropicalis]
MSLIGQWGQTRNTEAITKSRKAHQNNNATRVSTQPNSCFSKISQFNYLVCEWHMLQFLTNAHAYSVGGLHTFQPLT